MQKIESLIQTVLSTKKASVLAMIVDIEGSAYRKEGAWMLFQEGESPIGMISGGCLENDLAERADTLFHTGKIEYLSYDMSSEDDLGWGRGAGCNGIVYVLLRDVNHDFRKTLMNVYTSLKKKEPVLYIQSMQDYTQYTFVSEGDDPFGFWDSENDSEWINRKPFEKVEGQRMFGSHTYYIQLIWPQPHLYIIGAGLDARPLAEFASKVGFGVHVLDWREKLCQTKYFPEALSVRYKTNATILSGLNFSPLDAVVIMTHDFQVDLTLVSQLRSQQLLYFGVLGSKKRTARLVKNGTTHNIKTPVGLTIGADGPHEIAISIVAELIAVKRGENG